MLKKLTVLNFQSQKISGVLHENQSKTLLIIVPGYQTSKEDFAIKELATQLSKKYSVFRYDLADGINIAQHERDLDLVINFLRPKFEKIVLIGASLGALISIINVNKRGTSVDKLITVNGFFYFWGLRWKDFKLIILTFLTFPFNGLSQKILINYYSFLKPKNINIPMLLICGKKDERINFKQSKKFYESLVGNKTLKILDNIDHGLSKKEYVTSVVKEIFRWLK